MPYQRLASVILEEWRTVEGHLAAVDADSAVATLFREAAGILRGEYQQLVVEAIAHGRPQPPAFPEP